MRTNDQMIAAATQRAKNIEEKINYRLQGHTFWFFQGEIRCVGCGLGDYAQWKGDYKYRETAQKIAKEHGDCGKPFDLKKRIAEIEAQYAPKPQTTKKGEEITLETINAKLDKIIQRLGIW
jgi:hypothetical protein